MSGRWLACAVVVLAAVPAWADYEGTLKVTLPPGAPMTELNGSIHFKKGKLRMDYADPMQMVIIYDGPGKKTYQLFPKTKSYANMDSTKMKGPAGASQFPSCSDYSNLDACITQMGFVKAGTEKANGYDCTVYKKDVEHDGEVQHVKMWRPALKDVIFVKQTVNGKSHEMGDREFSLEVNVTDLKQKPQPETLFTVPSDYHLGGGMAPGGAAPATK